MTHSSSGMRSTYLPQDSNLSRRFEDIERTMADCFSVYGKIYLALQTKTFAREHCEG
jgi:hypothetical protein